MTGTGKSWTTGPSYTDCGGTTFDDCRGGNGCGHDCAKGKPSAHAITWGSLAVNFRWDSMSSGFKIKSASVREIAVNGAGTPVSSQPPAAPSQPAQKTQTQTKHIQPTPPNPAPPQKHTPVKATPKPTAPPPTTRTVTPPGPGISIPASMTFRQPSNTPNPQPKPAAPLTAQPNLNLKHQQLQIHVLR